MAPPRRGRSHGLHGDGVPSGPLYDTPASGAEESATASDAEPFEEPPPVDVAVDEAILPAGNGELVEPPPDPGAPADDVAANVDPVSAAVIEPIVVAPAAIVACVPTAVRAAARAFARASRKPCLKSRMGLRLWFWIVAPLVLMTIYIHSQFYAYPEATFVNDSAKKISDSSLFPGPWFQYLVKDEECQTSCGCNEPLSLPPISSFDSTHGSIILIPPGNTYATLNRANMVTNLVLSLEGDPDRVNEFQLRLWKCSASSKELEPMSTNGMSFVGFAESDSLPYSIKTSLTITPSKDGHTVSFYDEKHTDHFFNLKILLTHLGDQAKQDPPCKQGLSSRPHCLGETLWMDSVTQWMEVSDVPLFPTDALGSGGGERSAHQKQSKALPICNSLAEWTPGVWVNNSYWQPSTCRRPAIESNRSKVLLVGDSTLQYLSQTMPNHTKHIRVLLPKDIPVGLRTTKDPNYSSVFLGIGLHSACYSSSLEDDMNNLRPILKQLGLTWGANLVVRSTTQVAYLPGFDYNDKKCIYYTSDRLVKWNAWLKDECQKLGIVFWDFYAMTAAIGPANTTGWAATDGTHYCKPSKTTVVCEEEGRMIASFAP